MAKPVRRRVSGSGGMAVEEESSRNLIILGAIIAGIAILGLLVFFSLRDPPDIAGIVDLGRPERGHDDSVEYSENGLPPAGGVHGNIWQNCGIYNDPIDSKNAVHSLEHGAVWITYQPDLPANDVEKLKEYVRGDAFMLLSPFPNLRSPVVLTSWGYQLELDDIDDDRIARFIKQNRLGPRTPERGSCFDGTGTPDER